MTQETQIGSFGILVSNIGLCDKQLVLVHLQVAWGTQVRDDCGESNLACTGVASIISTQHDCSHNHSNNDNNY
jgi:hypothetical protein